MPKEKFGEVDCWVAVNAAARKPLVGNVQLIKRDKL